jgi:YHS domain-containing protein
MSRFSILVALASVIAFTLGCTTPRQAAVGATGTQSQATCCVCQYNNDLACVAVRVKDTTPKAEYGGKPYFFCSEACRNSFQKKPQKYLAGF